jgi:hypothetical protein
MTVPLISIAVAGRALERPKRRTKAREREREVS